MSRLLKPKRRKITRPKKSSSPAIQAFADSQAEVDQHHGADEGGDRPGDRHPDEACALSTLPCRQWVRPD